MAKPKWSIVSLLFATLCCAIAIKVCWKVESALEKQVRQELTLASSERLFVLERHPEKSKDNDLKELVVVIQNGQEYKLAFIYRDPTSSNHNFRRWEIGFVMVSGTEGYPGGGPFSRTFDHFPTDKDVQDLREWIAQW